MVFTYNGQQYDIVVTQAKGSALVVKLVTASGQFLGVITAATLLKVTQPTNDLNKLIADAGSMMGANKNGNMANKGNVKTLQDASNQVVADEQVLANDIQGSCTTPPLFTCTLLGNPGCFAAGTMLLTKEGWRAVESILEGDLVLARPEEGLTSEPEWKAVERKFERSAFILEMKVEGRLIRTTSEHLFYVEGKKWMKAGDLQVGQKLATLSGEWVTLDEKVETTTYEMVYNLRVADYHTYFVGGEGCAVWRIIATMNNSMQKT